VAARVATAASAIVLDPDADEPLGRVALPSSGEVMVIVGPEGGISPAEAGLLTGAGATAAHLGPTVLRASTAGAVAAAVLLSRTGRWA
jgi:16S rRNA (uracil1498-N3)-methyltransferase